MKKLTNENSYHTPADAAGFFSRLCPNLAFYLRILGVVFRSAHLAKRGRYDDEAWVRESGRVRNALEKSGVKLNIQGLDILTRLKTPAVFVGNHMSTLETFVLPGLIHPVQLMTFVVKRALVEMPVFKHVMRARNPIVVGRENPRHDLKVMMEEGLKRLESGVSVVVFPQTTRMLEFDPKQFNTIGVKLAQRAQVPVVPVAVKTDAWGIGRYIKDFGKVDTSKTVHIEFGEPMTVDGQTRDVQQKLVTYIQDKLAAWQGAD